MTELLAPAGDEQSAYAAFFAGADAVYLGLTRFSARESAENFDLSALSRVTRFAHILGGKVYVCFNTLVKDGETADFFENVRLARNAGADAVLIQDIFLGKAIKEAYPEIVLHLSTQAGCCNEYGARLAKECGFSRVVLARETPVSEIAAISQIIETEVFVQGALCTCFSGQCYFSSFAGGNSGNRGRCKQPCRKKYSIDRAGYEEYAYALSPADLCAGENVARLVRAGVSSLKIEGRMRRPEYVAAAAEYYRALLDGGKATEEFSRLKRAYNRGDYTKGLGFGQKEFLSRAVQGHIGEEAGLLSLRGGKYFCKSALRPQKGDGFKILRGGKEVGGGAFLAPEKDGFYLSSPQKLRAGDEVRITTDTQAGRISLSRRRTREINVALRFVAGERMRAEGEGVVLEGEVLGRAKTSPLTAEELADCFEKTDSLPLSPRITAVTEGAFCPKSALNAFRREFYARLTQRLAPEPAPLERREIKEPQIAPVRGENSAVIGGGSGTIAVYKPRDYSRCSPPAGAYLYLPAFFTQADEELLAPVLKEVGGIYCEGYYGVKLAEKYKIKLFAGTGFNLTNRFSVSAVKARAEYFALSKEISVREQNALAAEGAFALCGGAVKTMDLCYCPFEKTCADCDRRDTYLLTDEKGRAFPLRRYVSAAGCRFELYNCARLETERGLPSPLSDSSVPPPKEKTRGHSERSVL